MKNGKNANKRRRKTSLCNRTASSLRLLRPKFNPCSAAKHRLLLSVNAELVLTNVVVRDAKTGEFVHGLTQNDFTVYENGKKEQISTFDFQSVDMAKPLNEATVTGLAAGVTGNGTKAVVVTKPEDLLNHRLIVMFYDLTSMQPEDLGAQHGGSPGIPSH